MRSKGKAGVQLEVVGGGGGGASNGVSPFGVPLGRIKDQYKFSIECPATKQTASATGELSARELRRLPNVEHRALASKPQLVSIIALHSILPARERFAARPFNTAVFPVRRSVLRLISVRELLRLAADS